MVVCSDYNDFLEDLEEDPLYRQNINIYKGLICAVLKTNISQGIVVPTLRCGGIIIDQFIADFQ